jgi:hypothetical protein
LRLAYNKDFCGVNCFCFVLTKAVVAWCVFCGCAALSYDTWGWKSWAAVCIPFTPSKVVGIVAARELDAFAARSFGFDGCTGLCVCVCISGVCTCAWA